MTTHLRRRYNNDEGVAGSIAKSAAKMLYYYMFATLYGFMGGWANVSPKPSFSGGALDPPLPFSSEPCTRAHYKLFVVGCDHEPTNLAL